MKMTRQEIEELKKEYESLNNRLKCLDDVQFGYVTGDKMYDWIGEEPSQKIEK